MNSYDLAVLGLGAMGSAALYQLSKQGLHVVGIDKYAPPHTFGSSHGDSRITRQAIGEGTFYTPMVLRANEIWAELEKLSGEKLYNHCGVLLAAPKGRPFLQTTLKAAKEYNIKHEILNGVEAEQHFPGLNVADKDLVFYYESDAGYLRPERCIEVQLKLAKQNGAESLLNTDVTAITETKDNVQLTLANGETITANKVIVASGPWIKDMFSDELKPVLKTLLQTQYWFDVDPTYYEQLQPGVMPAFMCAEETTAISRSFYGFPMLDGPHGGMKFAVHETSKEVAPEDKDTATPATSAEAVHTFVSLYIRGLKPQALHSANCLYTMTPDENFIIDFKPGSERIAFASACSGHGFKHSAAIGEVLAEMVTKGRTTLDISELRLGRFKV